MVQDGDITGNSQEAANAVVAKSEANWPGLRDHDVTSGTWRSAKCPDQTDQHPAELQTLSAQST